MKFFLKSILLFVVIIFIGGTSCKKYPDGPLISLHSKEKRVVGEWIVSNYTINGYDSTSYLQAKPYYGKYFIYSERGDTLNEFGLISNDGVYGTVGHWGFTNDKQNLHILLLNCSTVRECNMNPYIGSDATWEIRRLTTKDLWLKTTFNGKEYFMKLKH